MEDDFGGLETAAPCTDPQTGLSASLRFGRENEWRRPGRFQLANFFESGVFEPTFDFVEAERVTFLGVDQHLYGKHERR